VTAANVLVVGAGPTGLSAAYHLGEDALLVERDREVGGVCRSTVVDGFTFDQAGHIMFSNDPYVNELYVKLLGDNLHWQNREAWIYSKKVYTRYPFQGSLYGLPPAVIRECLSGAIRARYGDWRATIERPHTNGHVNGASTNGCAKPGESIHDCCADGILEAEVPLAIANGTTAPNDEPRNFEEFIYRVWGAGIAKHFAIPYNRKLWAVPLDEMETSWLGGRVPLPDLDEMIDGALAPVPKPMGPNARFGYPLRGGFQALMSGFLPHLRGPLKLGTSLTSVDPNAHLATFSDGTTVRYDVLVSTIPLPELVRNIGDDAPEQVRHDAQSLRRVSVRCVNLGIGRERLTDKHWIYYPEDTVFHRIFVQGNASPECNPPGGFGLTCEITYAESKPLPCQGDALIARCIDGCRRVGIITDDDPVWTAFMTDIPYAYVVYDHARAGRVRRVRDWLHQRDILLAGRYSEWEYYNSDHAFVAGRNAAQQAQGRRAPAASNAEPVTGA